MSKLVALDLETTGNDPKKDQILQIAAVVFDSKDLDTPVEKLPHFSTFIKRDRYVGNAYALHMNAWIFDRIAKGEGVDSHTAMKNFSDFLDENEVSLASPVGFNVMSFDVAFLKNEKLSRLVESFPKEPDTLQNWQHFGGYTGGTITYGSGTTAINKFINPNMNRFKTTWEKGQFFGARAIELGTLFADKDGPASSSAISKKYLNRGMTHDALTDAQDAVRLWRVWAARQ